MFDAEQPDVNHDHPEVAADAIRTLRFWLDRGVDGIRFDAAGLLSKDADVPGAAGRLATGRRGTLQRPGRRCTTSTGRGRRCSPATPVTGWGWPRRGAAPTCSPRTSGPTNCTRPSRWTRCSGRCGPTCGATASTPCWPRPAAHGRLPAWVHGSHDVTRAATRWGPAGARAVLLLMLALPGSVYLYAGDELGLPEVDLPDDAIRDPVFRRSGGTSRGRDGARVPLPFPENASPRSWLPQPAGWSAYADQPAGNGTLDLTRRAIGLRNRLWRGRPAAVSWLDAPAGCLAFRRGARRSGVPGQPVRRPGAVGALRRERPALQHPGAGRPGAAIGYPLARPGSANGFGIESSSSRV